MKKLALIATVAALFTTGCAKPAPDYAAQYQPLIDGYAAGWNGDFEAFRGVLAPDMARTAPANQNADGVDAVIQIATDERNAYPDGRVVIDESHYEADVSFHLWTWTGTNTGPNPDGSAATGKPVSISGMSLVRYRDGKISEERVQFDVLDWYRQLGYTLTPPAAAPTAE